MLAFLVLLITAKNDESERDTFSEWKQVVAH